MSSSAAAQQVPAQDADQRRMTMPQPPPLSPKSPLVQSMDLLQRIERIPVSHSFLTSLAIDKVDKTLFQWPHVVQQQEERDHLRRQQQQVKQRFARLMLDQQEQQPSDQQLHSQGLLDLWRLSATEQVSVYEAMGASSLREEDAGQGCLMVNRDAVWSPDYAVRVIRLIIRNHLLMPLLHQSDNVDLAQRLLSLGEHGAPPKIAFAYTEKHASLGAMLHVDWKSEAKRRDDNTWLLSGAKSHVLQDDHEHGYVIFCKTADFEPEYGAEFKRVSGDRHEFAVMAFHVDARRLASVQESSEAGIPFCNISFPDLMLTSDDHLLLSPSQFGGKIGNIMSSARLPVSAFLLGRLKACLRDCLLISMSKSCKQQRPLSIPFTQHYLVQLVHAIYRLESLIYFVAGLHDSFDTRDLQSEDMLVKALACQLAHQSVDVVQRIVSAAATGNPADDCNRQASGSVSGTMHDGLSPWDSFLACPLHDRLVPALHSVRTYGSYENDHVHKSKLALFFVRHNVASRWSKRLLNAGGAHMELRLSKFMHPSLKEQSVMLERLIQRLSFLTEQLVIRHTSAAGRAQNDLIHLSNLQSTVLQLLALLTRASHAAAHADTGSEAAASATEHLNIVKLIAQPILQEARQSEADLLFNPTQIIRPQVGPGDRGRVRMHQRSLRYNGYFPFSPLDKLHY